MRRCSPHPISASPSAPDHLPQVLTRFPGKFDVVNRRRMSLGSRPRTRHHVPMSSAIHELCASDGDARPILSGYDGSTNAEIAVFWAAELAAASGRPLRLLTSYSLPAMVGVGMSAGYALPALNSQEVHEIDLRHKTMMSELSLRVKSEFSDLVTETFIDQGSPASALLRAAGDSAAIVLGTRGVGAAQGLIMGSVSYAVAHRAKCPVVLVPETSNRAIEGKVVVGIDGSSRSSQAAAWALSLAKCLHRPLEVVTAWHYPYQAMIPEAGMMMGPGVEDLRLALLRDAKQLVEREKQRLEGPHGTHIDVNAVEGSAADVLTEDAGPQDIVVVASKSHSLLASVLLGSTSTAVAHRSRGPVVIVHAN